MDDAGRRRRRPFRRRNTSVFVLVVAAITVALAGIVLGVSVLVYLEAREPADTGAVDTSELGDGFRGARVFVQADCGECHALAGAGATGTRGPNLDEHFASHTHSFEFLVDRIANGAEGMPAYRRRLTQREIRDLATFLVEVAGRDRP